MIDLIWDIFQQGQIAGLETKEKIQDARFEGVAAGTADVEARLRELEQRHEQLKLVTLAMWHLLRDHSGLLESDLRKYVESTDLLDGKADGKVSHAKERRPCPGCDRIVLSTAVACPYCGTRQRARNVFGGA